MSRGLVLLSLLPWWLVACGDGEEPDAPFDALCGEDAPRELLRLEEDEEVGWAARVGDGNDVHVVVNAAGDPTTRRRSVVVDECGEWVTPLDPRIDFLTRWGDELIGCVDTDLVRLWDYASDPMVLVPGGCAAAQVGEQWVTVRVDDPEAGVGRLTTIALEEFEGIEQPLFIVTSFGIDVLAGEGHPPPAVAGDRVYVQTTDLAILGVTLLLPSSSTLEVEQAEPGAWSVHGSALAYRLPVLDPDAPSPILVRDLQTGAEQALDVQIPASWRFRWEDDGLLVASTPGAEPRRFRLDPPRELLAPEGTRIDRARGDGLVWLTRLDEATGELELLRWYEGEAPRLAWSCTHCEVSSHQGETDSIDVLVRTPDPDRLELWRIDDAGGSARMLSSEVGHDYLVMDDGRVLSVLAGEDPEHGPLMLSDGAGGPGVTLAAGVDRTSIPFTLQHDVEDEIVYEARPSADEHALFRARLAP